MRSKIMTTIVAGVALTGMVFAEEEATSSVPATEVSVSADFASAYVYRGWTLLDHVSFQPGIEVSGLGVPEALGSLAIGIWGSLDMADDDGVNSSSNFQETDYYVSYGLPSFVEGLDLYFGYTEYSYSNTSSDKEFNAGAGTEVGGVGLGLALYQGVGGEIDTQFYGELSAGYELELSDDVGLSLGSRLGFLDGATESGFSDFDLSVGTSVALTDSWSLGLSGTYIGQVDDKVLPDGEGAYDVEFVGMIGLAGSF